MSAPSIRPNRLRPVLIAAVLVASLPTTSALASHTPNPTSVTVAGSLQSEAGCPDDWDPACATTHLAYDANDGVWQGTFNSLPAGNYEYKAPSTTPGPRTTGSTPSRTAPTSRSTCQPSRASSSTTTTRATGSPTTRLDHRRGPGQLPVRAGLLRRLGSGCLRSWLQDIDGDGIYTFETTALPAGSYEGKVAINESWDENYGAGGVPNGRTSPSPSPPTARRSPSPTTRRRTSSRSRSPRSRRARRPGRPVALRPGPQGLPGHGSEHRRRRSGTRSPAGSSATSTTRPSTTPTSRPSSTSSRTARPSPTSRPAT